MWKYLTDDKYFELLSSFNLVNTTDVKMINRILYNISNNADSNYNEIIIRKKSGNLRFLYEPSKILKSIQRRILKNVLEERKLSKYACAYRKNYGLLENCNVHVGKKIVLKLDIKNFFDSINFNKVYNECFYEGLYPKKLGMLFANLCIYNNKLPQGAPTSGYISNLVMRSFDEKLGKYCELNNISYTRYSDDMSFSGSFNVNDLISYVETLLKENGFKLNKKKTKIITQKRRQQITGIVVNQKLNVRKTYRRKIRQEMYYINKYGLENHLNRLRLLDREKYLRQLIGRINFVLQVNHNNKEFIKYKKTIMVLLSNKRTL